MLRKDAPPQGCSLRHPNGTRLPGTLVIADGGLLGFIFLRGFFWFFNSIFPFFIFFVKWTLLKKWWAFIWRVCLLARVSRSSRFFDWNRHFQVDGDILGRRCCDSWRSLSGFFKILWGFPAILKHELCWNDGAGPLERRCNPIAIFHQVNWRRVKLNPCWNVRFGTASTKLFKCPRKNETLINN